MANSIKTTGQLREFLTNMLVGIRDGLIEADKARNIVKMAAQINESFYSEIKIARVNLDLQRESAQLGELLINK